MRKVLVSWIGHTDLRAPEESEAVGVGPVAQALIARSYDGVYLVTDHEGEAVRRYVPWLEAHDVGCAVHNEESAHEPGYRNKKLSVSARNILFRYSWPGNVRELMNTLRRAAIWSDGVTIEADDVREALLPAPQDQQRQVLDRTLGNGFSLPDLIANVARHYLERAMEEAAGNKSRAADLVGLASYQTLTNWLSKYGVSR